MKIAILTQPLRYNYGGILQNYALQQVLRQQGHEVETIDVHRDRSAAYRYGFYVLKALLLGNIHTVSPPVSRKRFLRETIYLQRFIRENIALTPYVPNYGKLDCLPDVYDAYVVGSDQVWLKKFGTSMFFGFLPAESKAKRFAYAASFGAAKWRYDEALTRQCRELAAKFEAVSVREDWGVELCEEYLGVKAWHVLDPVLLLDARHYGALADAGSLQPSEEESLQPGRFIMTYILDNSKDKERIVREMSERLRLPVRSYAPPRHSVVPPLEHWLAGFRDAAYVVTDSFHGTVLSILFNRDFMTLVNARRGAGRFHSLLGMFHLEHRLFTEQAFHLEAALAPVDYVPVNRILEMERANSMDFIRRIA